MSHVPHELLEEFPGKADRIHALRDGDPHFRRLAEEYHEVNRAVHRAETLAEPAGEAQEAQLRRRRLLLKDQIAACLA